MHNKIIIVRLQAREPVKREAVNSISKSMKKRASFRDFDMVKISKILAMRFSKFALKAQCLPVGVLGRRGGRGGRDRGDRKRIAGMERREPARV